MLKRHPVWAIVGLLFGLAVAAIVIALSVIDEPLRRYAEREANDHLEGYRIAIGALSLHPLSLSVDLHDVVVAQAAHPDPPLATIPHVTADARLGPLIRGTVAADIRLDTPVFSATRQQVDEALAAANRQEAQEHATAWQDRLRNLTAFEGTLSLSNGHLTYQREPAAEPIRLQDVEVTARNLTNRTKKDEGDYPSELHVTARLLEQAQVRVNGQADFLATPHPAVKAVLSLNRLAVDRALALVGRTDLPLKTGMIEAAGEIEYAPARKTATITQVKVVRPAIEYVNDPASQDAKRSAGEAAAEAATWQDRALSLFPVAIRQAAIEDGEVVYRHTPQADPIRIADFTVSAYEIRNAAADAGNLPSRLHMTGRFPDQARIELAGRADFFAKPAPAVDAEMKIEDLRIAALTPIAEAYNVRVRDGVLDLAGRVRYANRHTLVAVDSFLLERADIDYMHKPDTARNEKQRVRRGAQQAAQAHQDPALVLKIGHGKILHSEVGFVNRSASPDYRVFLSDMNVDMDHFSNRLEEGAGVVKVTGKFMGSGPTVVRGSFRPEKPRPDFDLAVKIIKTKVKDLNHLLRAYGDVDTAAGTFALFSELSVKDDRIHGYVKPFPKDVEVYDPTQDKNKASAQKIYEAVVGGVLGLFENRPRNEAATKTDLSGTVQNPQAHTWEIVGKLVQNAFFKAILPGFEGQVGKA
ncbi:MAG TPA: DUF748 domain-containing protein [Nitrospira sp.]|nr:DUF748 domain-containing protein [Nitrospira sp.]